LSRDGTATPVLESAWERGMFITRRFARWMEGRQ